MHIPFRIFYLLPLAVAGLVQVQAAEPKLPNEMLEDRAMQMLGPTAGGAEQRLQSCAADGTGVVTIYTTTDRAQVGIDVHIDGRQVGSLTSHYADHGPTCNTDSSDGVITIVLPAGEHTLEAESLNLIWPGHRFTLDKCQCLSLPLS